MDLTSVELLLLHVQILGEPVIRGRRLQGTVQLRQAGLCSLVFFFDMLQLRYGSHAELRTNKTRAYISYTSIIKLCCVPFPLT